MEAIPALVAAGGLTTPIFKRAKLSTIIPTKWGCAGAPEPRVERQPQVFSIISYAGCGKSTYIM